MIGETLIACASCGCHARLSEVECPHCGHAMRRGDGSIERTAAAALLGLAALAAPLAGACDSAVTLEGNGGSAGAPTISGQGGSYGSLSDGVGNNGTFSMASSTYGPVVTTDATSGSGGPDCGNWYFRPVECDTCLKSVCCDELLACDIGTPPCNDYITCLLACAPDDAECIAACDADATREAKSALEAADECIACHCVAECGFRAAPGRCGTGGAGSGGAAVGGAGGAPVAGAGGAGPPPPSGGG